MNIIINFDMPAPLSPINHTIPLYPTRKSTFLRVFTFPKELWIFSSSIKYL